MARDNRLWGAERIRGELLKLGLRVCKRTIQKYMRQVRTVGPRGQNWKSFLHTHAEQIWTCDASPGHRLTFPVALCLLHHRTTLSQRGPCRRDTLSHRLLDRTYLFGKPPPTAWGRSTSSGIMTPSLEWASLGLRRRVASRCSQLLITPRARMPSVSVFWAVCGASVSITCSFCTRNNSTGCFMRICTTSTRPGRIKASSSRFQGRKLDQCHHIMKVGRSSPSQFWAACIVTIVEVHEFFQR
jgi:hypothetical protein